MTRHALFLLAAFALAGCDTTADTNDTDGGGNDTDTDTEDTQTSALCDGPTCENFTACPADEPSNGDECSFSGNCHYCVDGDNTAAQGYTCDGIQFMDQGTFDCSP